MEWLHRLRALARNLTRRSSVDRDLDEELRSYIDLRVDEDVQAGVSVDAARRRASREVGPVAAVTESVRSRRAGSGVERVWQDVRYALRGLMRAPDYTTAAILTLALGIGANTGIFAIVDAAVFKPLPYRSPQELVIIREVFRRGTSEQTFQIGMTWSQIDLWRGQPAIFSGLETWAGSRVAVAGPDGEHDRWVTSVSPGMTAFLGVTPILGRAFGNDDATPQAEVALISESFWRSAFAADPGVLGRTILVSGRSCAIVGVMPAAFRWGVGGDRTAIWLPLDERTERSSGGSGARAFVGAVARLRPGLTIDRANAEMAELLRGREFERVAGDPYDADLEPFDTRATYDATVKTRRALAALFAAVGCVLLIASANVANLVLARLLARSREFAVRGALGATQWRLFRQVLAEGALIMAAGGACALGAAIATMRVVPAYVPSSLALFEANAPVLDRRVVACWVVGLVVAFLVSSVVPAARAVRAPILGGLEGGPRVSGPDRQARRLRLALQAAQIALTLVLLTGAGLFAMTIVRMNETPAGFDIDHLIRAEIAFPQGRYQTPASKDAFFAAFLSRLRAIPGIQATGGPPPVGQFGGRFQPFGAETGVRPGAALNISFVAPDYLGVAGIALKSGRFFTADEFASAAQVGVIDEHAAEVYWPGQSAIGQKFRYSPYAPWMTVIGIVGHVKTSGFTSTGGTVQAYVPATHFQFEPIDRPLLLRTTGRPEQAIQTVISVLHGLDPEIKAEDLSPVADLYDDLFVEPRFLLLFMSAFAGIALVTAAVGLYGVVNYDVGRRVREIGIRLAVGADAGGVLALVLRQALVPVASGLALGLAASLALSRYLSTLLYGVTPHDPETLTFVAAFLIVVAVVAAYVPARRATRINPIAVLRAE